LPIVSSTPSQLCDRYESGARLHFQGPESAVSAADTAQFYRRRAYSLTCRPTAV